ncbi:hypothetical protein BD413DRAFT_681589 [Trametes elegans]|nr:hypothetical protein BD413DRAFT_681589 [Trametes elegans]
MARRKITSGFSLAFGGAGAPGPGPCTGRPLTNAEGAPDGPAAGEKVRHPANKAEEAKYAAERVAELAGLVDDGDHGEGEMGAHERRVRGAMVIVGRRCGVRNQYEPPSAVDVAVGDAAGRVGTW